MKLAFVCSILSVIHSIKYYQNSKEEETIVDEDDQRKCYGIGRA